MMADGYTRATGQDGDGDRAERAGHHQLRDRRSRPPTGTTRRSCWSRRRRRTGPSARAGSRRWSRWRCSATWSATRRRCATRSRIAEVLNRVIEKARRGSAPAQINVPRDFWTQVIDIELPQVVRLERPAGGARGGRGGGAAAGRGAVPGDPERRRRGARGGDPGVGGAGRAAGRAGRLRLPAQRRLPGLASAERRAARLQRVEGGDGADRAGRRGAGARHAAQPVLDAAGLRDRLLAEGRRR